MIRYVSIQEASGRFAELVESLAPGDEIVLTEGHRTVARISPSSGELPPRRPGTLKGKPRIIDDSNDWVAEHFNDYM